MNTTLWIIQIVLAAAFVMAGAMKLSQGKKLQDKMAWMEGFSEPAVRSIGAVELLGGIGLVLPAATDIAPWLTPLAAAGLAVTMVGAVLTHVRLKDPIAMAVPSIVLGLLSLFVAWQRFGPNSF
ncbi:putative integral membrane protein [Janibacter sp. HTCC2649]|uniref:DoxX family protein n=1 Tax=Janibacter sp. HTCC2649 TaxID=313589 RepID=UPI000067089B|nr:DoxX family protein [Janibacter sp. HTCC2649]EAQ00088.1 putative integral membrane protein [Janibacter sp. HTCC2649]